MTRHQDMCALEAARQLANAYDQMIDRGAIIDAQAEELRRRWAANQRAYFSRRANDA
jgi:hypothetical protein